MLMTKDLRTLEDSSVDPRRLTLLRGRAELPPRVNGRAARYFTFLSSMRIVWLVVFPTLRTWCTLPSLQ